MGEKKSTVAIGCAIALGSSLRLQQPPFFGEGGGASSSTSATSARKALRLVKGRGATSDCASGATSNAMRIDLAMAAECWAEAARLVL